MDTLSDTANAAGALVPSHAPLGPGLAAPLSVAVRRALRQAVVDQIRLGPVRSRPRILHVGRPGEDHPTYLIDDREPTDAGLRTDLVAALLARAGVDPPPLVWLSRAGVLELEDDDARWLAAARAAFAETDVPLSFVVVTRRGWRDPRSGLERTWVRLRPS